MKTLYKNAKIFTANDEALYADAMVVEDGVITAIGEESQCGPADEVVDLEGKRVLPGLIDAHMHGLMLAGYSQQISALPPKINSIADLSEAIKEVAAAKEPGDWIRGWGFDEGKFAEHRQPTRWDLDKGTTQHPVYILRSLTAERITQAAGQSAQATAPQPDPRASQRQSQRQIDADSRTDSARPLSYSIPLLNNKYKQSVYGGGGIPQGGRPPATAAGTAYQHAVRIGFLPTPDTAERISRLVIAYGPEMVREGLNRCAVRQAANFLYLEGALRGARRDGGWGRSRPPARANPSLAYMQRAGRDNAPNMPDWLRAELEGEQHGHDTDPDLPDHREAAEAAG